MVISFPNSPTTNDIHSQNNLSWRWNGSAWLSVNAGVQGAQGLQGFQGIQGITGNQGVNGTQGTEGTQGTAGFVGSNGAQGTQGEQGIQGIQGIQGLQGTAGFVGSNGAQGTQGTQGIQGLQGTQGIQGLKGTKITPGDTAPGSPSENDLWWDSTNGILMVYYNDGTSSQWVTANSGIAGEQGIQGTQGTQGVQGTQGTQGIQGLQGVQGTQGTQGVQGIQGITGLAFTIAKTYASVAALTADTSPTAIVAGQFALINTSNVEDAENSRLYIWTGSAYTFVDDLSGSAGIQGITGSQGTQGTQGVQGIQGTQGTQGLQGITGAQGISGASILGLNNTFTGVNSININGTVGATTPSTVAGTTGTFSSGFITNNANSATELSITNTNTGVSARARLAFVTDLGTSAFISYRRAIGDFIIGSDLNIPVSIYSNAAAVATFTSTGLAVTGTLSATGNLTLSAANSSILGGTSTGSSSIYNSTGASGFTIYGPTHATKANQIDVFAGGLGHTFNSTGFAVSGALSATGDVTLAATSNLVANKSVLLSDGTAGTATGAIYFINDTDTGFYRAGGNTLGFMGNGASLGTWSPTSLAVTGALSSTTGANFATSSGAVGVGTASPSGKLQVVANTASAGLEDGFSVSNAVDSNCFLQCSGSAATDKRAVIGPSTGTALAFQTGASERMRINSSGNVGIGTSSPNATLDVNGNARFIQKHAATTGAIILRQAASDAEGAFIQWVNNANAVEKGWLTVDTSSNMKFATVSTERMRIDSSGNLLVGTTSVINSGSNCFDANAATYTVAIRQQSASGSGLHIDVNANNGTSQILFGKGAGTNTVIIYSNGNIVNVNNSYGALSDAKLKENIFDATPKLDDLMKVKIRQFNLVSDKTKTKQIGVIAQELEEVFAGMVDTSNDKDVDGNDLGTTTKSVKYSVFVPILIKSLQEMNTNLVAELQSLRARVAALEAK